MTKGPAGEFTQSPKKEMQYRISFVKSGLEKNSVQLEKINNRDAKVKETKNLETIIHKGKKIVNDEGKMTSNQELSINPYTDQITNLETQILDKEKHEKSTVRKCQYFMFLEGDVLRSDTMLVYL